MCVLSADPLISEITWQTFHYRYERPTQNRHSIIGDITFSKNDTNYQTSLRQAEEIETNELITIQQGELTTNEMNKKQKKSKQIKDNYGLIISEDSHI